MDKNLSFPARSWQTLSAIDVTDHSEYRGNLSFLAWSWAWITLMEIYPESTYEMLPVGWLENGTAEVTCEITLRDGDEAFTRRMWLPVMDNRNNSIPNPTTREISDAKMRCLVKCLAMFGLGTQLYAKSDVPVGKDRSAITKFQIKTLDEMLKKAGRSLEKFLDWAEVESLEEVPAHRFQEALAMIEKQIAAKNKQ